MNALELAIKQALALSGSQQEVNLAYLEFIKANFIIPIEKSSEAEPRVLFLQEGSLYYLPVFTEEAYLRAWAWDIAQEIAILRLSGVDLLKDTGSNTTVCLNIGSPIYKAFNPAELARMRSMVIKIFPDKKNPI